MLGPWAESQAYDFSTLFQLEMKGGVCEIWCDFRDFSIFSTAFHRA